MPSAHATPRSHLASRTLEAPATAYWVLRVGAAACFIGHGAFGFITKAAWLPYFGVVGIPEPWAWRLMPVVGAVDVLVGMSVLFAPRGLPLAYMGGWALWTALLRPLAGESVFETLERAGNYGVPFALLLIPGMRRTWGGLLTRVDGPASDGSALPNVRRVLQWTTVLLLLGHGGLGAFAMNPELGIHYGAIGLPVQAAVAGGWFEIGLAVAIAVRPHVGLLLFIAAWKVATESLFMVSGAPIWEFVERAGSYAAPLALALLQKERQAPACGRITVDQGDSRIATWPRRA